MLQGLTNLLSYRIWAIESNFAEHAVPVLLRHLMSSGGSSVALLQEQARKKMAVRYNGLNAEANYASTPYYVVKAKNGSRVAIIPVIGSLTKRGEMCSYGMRDFADTIQAINEDESIDAIVLDAESPGGTVDGTPEFGMAVKNSRKPIGVFGDCCLASAGIWFASQARFIMGNKNNPTEFGSIGTLYVHVYAGKWIEKNVGEIKIIRAPQSHEKARINELEPLEAEQLAALENDLKILTDQFIKTVKKGRGNRLDASAEGLFNGRMFTTDEAIEIGLIDYKGTIMDAVNKAADLASSTTSTSTNSKSKNSNMKIVPKAVSSFFKGKKASKKAAAEPTAAEPQGVEWAEELVFNTDGSGDGAICNHPDSEGNIRNFETKIDNNTGNEPPVDPAVTEDDNWAQVQDEASEEEAAPEDESTEAKAAAQIKTLNTQVAKLSADAKKNATVIASLKRQLGEANAKLENKPAAQATTVTSKSDKGPEYAGKKPVRSWEKKAAKKVGQVEE